MTEWITQFNDNYSGKSPEAKALEPFLKTNFKGNAYLPWATMERMLYQQDPKAVITKGEPLVNNDDTYRLIHSERTVIRTEVNGQITLVESYAHFVVVSVTFLGRTFTEHYPIQDAKYEALKTYDQNMVNKALQRATAKCISRATGLGLSLYEKGELQFDDPTPTPTPAPTPKKTVVQKTADAMKELDKVVPGKTMEADGTGTTTLPFIPENPTIAPSGDAIEQIVAIIKDGNLEAKVTKVLRSFNPSFVKQYGFSVASTDDIDTLRTNLSKIADPDKFLTAIERMTK